jgi:hypothetical protein
MNTVVKVEVRIKDIEITEDTLTAHLMDRGRNTPDKRSPRRSIQL